MADYENKVVSHISVYLDKTEKNLPAYVYAKQYDSNSRYIVVRVLTESGTYVPPEVCQLNATKPDGNMAYVEGEVNADNTVSFLLTSNLLAYHGTVSCDISFFSSGENQSLLTTSTFYIVVGRSNFDADAVESTTEEMIAIIAEAKAAGDAAQEIADEVQRKLDDGEFIGPPGPKGDPGESLKGAGVWDSTKSYSERSMVSYNGSSYMAITDVPPGVLITDDYYWMLVAQKGDGDVPGELHLVVGPATDTVAGVWTGEIDGLKEYYDGLMLIYVPKVAGASTTTLNVNELGAKKCIRQATSNLTTHYGAGTAILMTYRSDLDGGNGAWQAIADYDSTDVSNLRPNYARYYTGDYPLYQYKICAIDAKERIQPLSLENTTAATKTQNPIAFKPDMLYYFNTNGTTAANSIISAQSIYYATYSPYSSYTFNDAVPVYHTIYLVGSFDSATGLFTLDQTDKTSWYKFVPYNSTFTKNEDYFEEGKYYIYVGRSYSTNNYYNVEIYNPMYYFDGHSLVLTNAAAERTNDILGGKVTNQVYENLSIAQNKSILSTDGENYAQKIRLKEIIGKTKPINQLYDHSAWDTKTVNGVELAHFDDGSFTLNGVGSASGYTTLCNVSITAGHAYLLYRGNDEAVDAGNNTAFLQLYGGSGNYAQIKNNATFAGVIWTAVNNYAAGVVRVRINGDTVYTNHYVKIKVVDLTMVYGAGNEPTEVDTVLSDNPWILATNEVIPSELYSSVISGIRVNGVNLWNEEWEVGTFNANTGVKGASSQRIRSANFIKVMPNTYYFGVSTHPLTVYKYDKNKNYIGYVAGSNRAILTDPNCCYVNIALGSISDPIQTYDSTTALVIGNIARPYSPHRAPWEFMLPAPETLGTNDVIRFSSQTNGTWNVEKVEGTVITTLIEGLTEPDIATLIELNGSVEIVGNTNEYLVDPDLAVISSIHVGDFGSDDTNQTVKVGTTTFGANDAVEFVAGENITITPDTQAKKITISSSGGSSPSIITFSISGVNYSAVNGMTWGEWIISKYNTSSIEFKWPETIKKVITDVVGHELHDSSDEASQYLNTVIQAGTFYYLV